MKSLLITAGIVFSAAIVLPAQARTDVSVSLAVPGAYVAAGPQLRSYEAVPAPRAGYVWTPGYWNWNGRQNIWVGGYWEAQPQTVYYAPVYSTQPVYYAPQYVAPHGYYGHGYHHGWGNDGWRRDGNWRDDDHRGRR